MTKPQVFWVCLNSITAIFGPPITLYLANQSWEEQAIERDYGLYCPNTGDFAWKGECDE
jgi:hypothetical protein